MNIIQKIFGRRAPQVEASDDHEPQNALDYKKRLSEDVFKTLKTWGFKKAGQKYNKILNDLSYFIQIQSSQSSTKDVWIFTLNIGIASIKLCELTGNRKPDIHDCHWRKRIGFYLDKPIDKWWAITDLKTMEEASKELNGLLKERVLPEMLRFRTTNDLVDFWEKGNYHGLTEGQGKYFLNLLGH